VGLKQAGLSKRQVKTHPHLDYLTPQGYLAEQEATGAIGAIRKRTRLSATELKAHKESLKAFLCKQITPTKQTDSQGILHVHNVNLGKNPLLNVALYEMAWEGYKIVNHCHDFAEDGRFANYAYLQEVVEGVFRYSLGDVLYPSLPNYQYGYINSRDGAILKSIVSPKHVHELPNPVEAPKGLANKQTATAKQQIKQQVTHKLGVPLERPLVVYPVRGIRRKNVGEWILLSALFPNKASWAISQPAVNKVEKPAYSFWTQYAKQKKLPVVFEAGNKVPFPDLLAAADLWGTTSVVEGFGMSFLEPWLQHRRVIGRNIPMVTQDFAAQGLDLQDLYSAFKIPKSWVRDLPGLQKEYAEWIAEHYHKMGFQTESPQYYLKALQKEKFSQKWVDFAHLDRSRQREVIDRVLKNPKERQLLVQMNHLEAIWETHATPHTEKKIQYNQKRVARHFSLDKYQKQLNTLYRQLAKAPTQNLAHSHKRHSQYSLRLENPALPYFLSSEHFYLIQR
jgi:hypothetical protein